MNKEKLVDKQPPVFNTICCRNDPPPMFPSYIYLPKQVKKHLLKARFGSIDTQSYTVNFLL